MPRMTDEQTWAILTAPAHVTDHQLARDLSLTYSAVHARRWTLRTKGWTCRLRIEMCLMCGELVTMPPTRSRSDRPYHPECRPEAERRRQRDFYAHQTPAQLQQERRVSKASVATIQEDSLTGAVNRGAPWTESEDAYLEANLHRTPRELAAELNRSYYGVESRLKRIRKKKSD